MQYCYIVKPRSSIDANIDVYKVGRTCDMEKRIKGYQKGSKIMCCSIVHDSKFVEKQIINRFKELFKIKKDYGNEYFEGKIEDIIEEFSILTNIHLKTLKNIQLDAPKNIQLDTPKNIYNVYIDQYIRKYEKKYIVWTELKNHFIEWFKENINDKEYKVKDIKKYFEKNVFECEEKQVRFNGVRFRGWIGWKLLNKK